MNFSLLFCEGMDENPSLNMHLRHRSLVQASFEGCLFKLRPDVHHRINLEKNFCISLPSVPLLSGPKYVPQARVCTQLHTAWLHLQRHTWLRRQWALAWGHLPPPTVRVWSHNNYASRRAITIILWDLNATSGKALISAAIAILHFSLALHYSCDADSQCWLKK